MAWLHAVPKPPEGSRRAQIAGQAHPLSRLDQMKRNGVEPKMPPNPLPHLINWLIEIGITESSGMGPLPLSWREIRAWQNSVHVRLAPWEARLLRHLSVAYIAQGRKAESENCPAPWRTEVTRREREIEEEVLRTVLG